MLNHFILYFNSVVDAAFVIQFQCKLQNVDSIAITNL